jgi:hypothetical protein
MTKKPEIQSFIDEIVKRYGYREGLYGQIKNNPEIS